MLTSGVDFWAWVTFHHQTNAYKNGVKKIMWEEVLAAP